MNKDRVRKFLAAATSDDEKITVEEIQSVAYLRRAMYMAYVNAKFSPAEALRLLAAELAAPTLILGSDEVARSRASGFGDLCGLFWSGAGGHREVSRRPAQGPIASREALFTRSRGPM